MMFVTQSQKDYIDAATGTESKREFMESETANRIRALGADPEIAYDLDLPPPVDGDEDTDLEDAFMDPGNEDGKVFNFLSKIRHDYRYGVGDYKKKGQERLEKNRELIPAAKESMQSSMEEAANRAPRDISAYGLDDTGNAIYNFTKAGIDFVRTGLEPAEVGMAQAGLMEMYDRLPDGTWKGTKRFARSVFTDPVNFVGGVANFKLVRQLLSKGGTKAVRDHIMERAAKAAGYTIIGAEGSAYAAMAEYMNQKLSHDPEQGEWQPDWPQIFAMGGFGAVAASGGTAAIRAVPDAVRAVKDSRVVRDLFDAPAEAGTTLTSGVGPVPRTAANEATDPAPVFFSAVSKAVDALPMEKGVPVFGAAGVAGGAATSDAQADNRQMNFFEMRPLKSGEFRQNPDGSRSTELTISEKLNNEDQFTNIPTLWMTSSGIKEFTRQQAIEAAQNYEARTGDRFQRFNTLDDAVDSAKQRSNQGGVEQRPNT